ncbi:MAG: YaiI/YqxD family protein [Lentisphaeria bacterium]
MKILVDADACPQMVREVILKVAERRKLETIFVANKFIRLPQSDFVSSIMVSAGLDVADDKIVELAIANDIVISSDIPLADLVVNKGAIVITPRGFLLNEVTIKERLAMRNMLTEMRNVGIESGGPTALSERDKENFTNQLEKMIVKIEKEIKLKKIHNR